MQHRGLEGSTRHRKYARGSGRPTSVQRSLRTIPAALGLKIRSLTIRDVSDELTNDVGVTNCQYLASYNLMEGLTRNRLVPGRPPLWTPSPDNTRLEPDGGDYYRDENAARFPEHPFEPVVSSIYELHPHFVKSIDIAACGSTLGNLLRYVRGHAEPFTFTVEIIGQTAFFVRREHSPTQLIDGVHGYGHAFVEHNTTWSLETKGSSSHQRIITYNLGQFKLLVRFEADGYMMDQCDDSEDDASGGAFVDPSPSVEDLVRRLSPSKSAAVLEVQKKGGHTAQSSIIDIKTRSVRKDRVAVLEEQLPRLWLRQIGNIVLSFHRQGIFDPPEVEDISSMLLNWEMDNQAAITRFLSLIGEIKTAALKVKVLEVRCEDSDTVHFHEVDNHLKWQALPSSLRDRWSCR